MKERQIFLDRFIKEVCQLPYLYESQEFQTFLRPQGELEKALDQLPKLGSEGLLKRFREVMPINEMASEFKIKQYNEVINDFVRDCRELMDHLKKFKAQIKIIVPIKEQEVQYYKDFIDFLIKYEECNLKKVQSNEQMVSLLVGEHKIDLKQTLTTTVKQLFTTNSYFNYRVKTFETLSSTSKTGSKEKSWNFMPCLKAFQGRKELRVRR